MKFVVRKIVEASSLMEAMKAESNKSVVSIEISSFSGPKTTMTVRQQKGYEYIKQYSLKNKKPPTLREMKEDMGYKSINSAKQIVDQLVKQGLVFKKSNEKRGIFVV